MRIEIRLPFNRALPGWLRLLDGKGNLLYGCAALGKADNAEAIARRNPKRDPLRPYGDTPLGMWRGRISARPMADTRTYGVHRVIMLEPIGGDALLAHKNGRRGIWIHGGSLRIGSLRPTFGCIRIADASMGALLEFFTIPPEWIPVDTLAA